MTDNEKLDLLIERVGDLQNHISGLKTDMTEMKGELSDLKMDMTSVKGEISGLKGEVSGLKTDMTEMKGEISGLKGDVSGLKTDMTSVKGEISGLRGELSDVKTDVQSTKMILENEIRVNIQRVAEGHLDLSRNLHEAMKPNNTMEMLQIQVSVLESKVKELERKVS